MVGAAPRLDAALEQGVRSDHLGYGQTGTHALAELPEGAIGNARHRRDEQLIAKRKTEKFHAGKVPMGKASFGFYRDCCRENRHFLPRAETPKGFWRSSQSGSLFRRGFLDAGCQPLLAESVTRGMVGTTILRQENKNG